MEEVKLFNDKKEQMHVEDCADLFAMLKALEHLERAYIKDWVKAEDYEKACEKLISQFKAHFTGALKEKVGSIDSFSERFSIIVPKAIQRLAIGMPATREHLMPMVSSKTGNTNTAVMAATTAIITAIDSMKINLNAVDEILPYLTAVMDAFRQLALPPTFQGNAKIRSGVSLLNDRAAHCELTADEVRQLAFDLENCFKQFEDHVKSM